MDTMEWMKEVIMESVERKVDEGVSAWLKRADAWPVEATLREGELGGMDVRGVSRCRRVFR